MFNWPWTRHEPSNIEVIERLEAVERRIKALSTDWDQTYEQFQRLNAKLAQRWKRLQQAEQEASTENGEAGAPTSPDPSRITNPLAIELMRGHR